VNGILYVKLRDDPATVQALTLPVTPMQTVKLPAAPGPAPAAVPAAPPEGQKTPGAQTQPQAPSPQ
jgi:hypothetical protein